MQATSSRLLVIFLLVILVIAGIIFAIRQSPSADEASTEPDINELTSTQPTTIWGKVTYSDGKVASGITVTIGGIGQVTNDKGEYAASVYSTGDLPVSFQSKNKKTLEPSDATQAGVTVTPGVSIHRDFVIQRAE